jgi:hypothetical protein
MKHELLNRYLLSRVSEMKKYSGRYVLLLKEITSKWLTESCWPNIRRKAVL